MATFPGQAARRTLRSTARRLDEAHAGTDLRERFCPGIEIRVSPPLIPYRETIVPAPKVCSSMSHPPASLSHSCDEVFVCIYIKVYFDKALNFKTWIL